jgi:hypothetical protein
VKFLCIACDSVMAFAERQLPGDGTLAAMFTCPKCDRSVAMLTNPMETQLVSSLGIQIGGKSVPDQPFELTRTAVDGGRSDAFADAPAPSGSVVWEAEAKARLERVPTFVRGMVLRIYNDYAKERGIRSMTTEVMDTARRELGLEGM